MAHAWLEAVTLAPREDDPGQRGRIHRHERQEEVYLVKLLARIVENH